MRGTGSLHVITASQRRGAELFAVDLSAALAAQGDPRDRQLDPRVVALTEGPQGNTLGVDILGTEPLALATLRALRRAASAANVVVAYGSKTLPASVLALLGRSTPLVYRNIGDPLVWSGQGLRRRRTALLMSRADHVVAVWPGSADTLTRVHGIPRERITVIPRGVPAADYPLADEKAQVSAREALGLPPDVSVVTCIGSLSSEKDVATAVAAVAPLDDVHLLVVGDGPDRADLEAQARAVAPGRVHFAGVLPGSQPALAAADAVLLTSRTEGVPGVLIEAGLTGRAAIASDVGGVGHVVLDGKTGALVAPGAVPDFTAAIRQVLADRTALAHAAREHCLANFEIEVVATQWAGLLGGLTR